jgi:hypothetical protein
LDDSIQLATLATALLPWTLPDRRTVHGHVLGDSAQRPDKLQAPERKSKEKRLAWVSLLVLVASQPVNAILREQGLSRQILPSIIGKQLTIPDLLP